MPKPTLAAAPTDLDYDLAMLSEPLSDASLDALSSIADARDAIGEMLARLDRLQGQLEGGRPAYEAREAQIVDLDELANLIHIAVSGILG